jgi:cephalosporin hydroxylase
MNNMSEKKIYTRQEFEELRKIWAQELADDIPLQHEAREVFIKADRHNWIHQTNWLGEPVLQVPHDMFAMQEIIYKTRPNYIIEIGVAWGGSLLFNATLQEVLGGKYVIGVDIFIPDDLKERLNSHSLLSKRIKLIEGSSLDNSVVDQIKKIVGTDKKVMVILDSYHSQEHVIQELNKYSPFCGEGQYLVVCDTIVDMIPPQTHRPRPWGPGNNPKTALDEFLKTHAEFMVDTEIDRKLLFTCNPSGYLKHISK